MAQNVLKPFAQPRSNTAVEVNKESIARNFGVSTDSVAYVDAGMSLDGVQVLYDQTLQRAYPLPAGIVAGATIQSYSAGQLTYVSGSNITQVDLNQLCVKRGLWFMLYGYDFVSGATMQYANDVLEYYDGTTESYSWYRWAGSLPKIVTSGTNPTKDSKWVIVGTQAISSALSGGQGAAQVGWGTTNVGAMLNDHEERMLTLEGFPTRVETLETDASTSGERIQSLEAYKAALLLADGEKNIGWVADLTTLRKTEPTIDGQRVRLREYTTGSKQGGGYFVYDANATTQADDGGYYIVTAGGKRWKRDKELKDLTIVDFGGQEGGTYDCSPAALRMHNFAVAQNEQNNIGIVMGAGLYGFGTAINLGTKEISVFRIRGVHINYGVMPATRITFLKNDTTPAFTFTARRFEVANIRIVGSTSNKTPFISNLCTGGQYVNVRSFVANACGGRVFSLIDTIDTCFEQVYAYGCTASFIYVKWSNRVDGVWDHPTAIEIKNANFSSCKGEPVLNIVRCGQSMMNNVWFQACEFPFDISQGGWTLKDVSIEGCTNGGYTQYSKLIVLNLNVQNGPGLDNTKSTYDASWDVGSINNGNIPSWVTSPYERGVREISPKAARATGGTAEHFKYSNLRLENLTNQKTWFNVGTIAFQNLGNTCKMRIIGAAGWDGTTASQYRPDSTNFGAGEAIIRMQMKTSGVQVTSIGEMTWYGEGSCPILAVKYVHNWNSITVYVQMAQYARYAGIFLETDGTSRLEAGVPFYITPSLASISDTDMAAVANVKTALSIWNVNKGAGQGAGLAMNMDTGDLLMYGANVANEYISFLVNGNQRYIRTTTRSYAQTLPYFTLANLPNVNDGVFSLVLVTDSPKTPAMQPVYSNGYSWYYVVDGSVAK